MTTHTIGIRDFRQNMTKLYQKAQKQNLCFIVMNHQTPVMRVSPIEDDELILEKYSHQIAAGLSEMKQGTTMTLHEVRNRLMRKKKE